MLQRWCYTDAVVGGVCSSLNKWTSCIIMSKWTIVMQRVMVETISSSQWCSCACLITAAYSWWESVAKCKVGVGGSTNAPRLVQQLVASYNGTWCHEGGQIGLKLWLISPKNLSLGCNKLRLNTNSFWNASWAAINEPPPIPTTFCFSCRVACCDESEHSCFMTVASITTHLWWERLCSFHLNHI